DRFTLRERLSDADDVSTHHGIENATDRDVVVKMLATDALHPATLMRAEYEANHAQRLTSRWLADTIFVGREHDQLVLVYEYVRGVTLDERLAQGPLTLSEAIIVGRSMFSALRDLHQHGLLHRGIRPSNIVVNADGPVRSATILPIEPVAGLNLEEMGLHE